MLYRLFGKTGLKISVFSLGSWVTFDKCFQQADVNTCMSYAFDQGINLFDTAEVYGEGKVEKIIGQALSQLKLPRDEYVMCTKVFWGGRAPTQIGLHRKHIIEACNNSLMRLGLSYIDCYLCHRPDPHTPIEETVIAMDTLIKQGKILYWGTSEWPSHLILEAYYVAKEMHLTPPNIEQFEYNLFCREKAEKIIPELNSKIALANMVTMPLASGILAGRYNEGIKNNSRAKLKSHPYFREVLLSEAGTSKVEKSEKMSQIAKNLGVSQAQLGLAWCLLNQNIHTVLLGVSSLTQLQENINTLSFLDAGGIDAASLASLENIFANKPVPSHEPTYAQVIAGS